MAAILPNQFYQKLESAVSTLYFFYGDETFLIEDAVKRVHQKIFGTTELRPSENLSLEVFYGSERPTDAIVNATLSLGFFSTQKMILVKEAGSFKEKDFKALTKLIDEPIEGSTLVFILEGSLPRSKFYKTLSEKSVTVNFKTPYEREFPQWIQYLAKSQGLTLGNQVPHLLLSRIGTNLLAINNELQKLKLAAGDKTLIDDELVQNWIAQSKEESVFDLANAIGSHDQTRSFTLLRRLLFQGQTAVGLVAIVARHLRILLQLKISKDTSSLGIPPFFMKEYQRQSQNWSLESLSSAIQDLRQAESLLKSSSTSADLVMSKFIADQC